MRACLKERCWKCTRTCPLPRASKGVAMMKLRLPCGCVAEQHVNEISFGNALPGFNSALPVIRVTTHMHHCVNHYEVTFYAIVNTVWKAPDKMAPHIFFDSLPGFRICHDFIETGFDGLDERFGQLRANIGIIGHSTQIFFKRLRVEGVLHLLTTLRASVEAS